MAKANDIVKYCQKYLTAEKFDDFCHNGLQIEGAKEVERIVTGVSFSQKLIEIALEKKAEMIIVHHGIFSSDFQSLQIRGVFKERVKKILENNINLVAFHLPLDAHPKIGNNISICKKLNIIKTEKFDVGFIGDLKKPMVFGTFLEKVNKLFSTDSFFISSSVKKIRRVGVVSGSSSNLVLQAKERGIDTFLCGDVKEHLVRLLEEEKINLVYPGHYNTEKYGVQNLGELLAKKYNVIHEFVDIPCSV